MSSSPLKLQFNNGYINNTHWMILWVTAFIRIAAFTRIIHFPSHYVRLLYAFPTTTTTTTFQRDRYHVSNDYDNRCVSSYYSLLSPRQSSVCILFSQLKLSSNDDPTLIETTTTTTTPARRGYDMAVSTEEDHRMTMIKKKLLELMTRNQNVISPLNNDNRVNDDTYGPVEIAAYQLFRSLRDLHTSLSNNDTTGSSDRTSEIPSLSALFGMKGYPFVLRRWELEQVFQQFQPPPPPPMEEEEQSSPPRYIHFVDYFTMKDLQQALVDDFLDAARGSTDPRTGWKITDVSVPRGESFEEARMTYTDVCDALDKGTVIFNAAGAHIPQLAGICLAACDATSLPCALNMYITAAGKRTSAPPHTDKQDVCVLQTQGCKAWKVFAVPDPSIKPNADIFARGKGDDNLPLHILKENSELLLETTIYPGDVLFIPAGFPHTTSTVATINDGNDDIVSNIDRHDKTTSVHLTLGIDHHIWELNYLSVIRLAYRRAGRMTNPIWDNINDTSSNPFVGKINLLPPSVLKDVMAELPLGLLDADGTSFVNNIVEKVLNIIAAVDPDNNIDANIIREAVERIRQQGIELLETHCDMYMAAIQEGRTRAAENTMTAHLGIGDSKAIKMSSDRIQRLSLFRVKKYYDLINDSIDRLKAWSLSGATTELNIASPITSSSMSDVAINKVILVGDKVEAELGGAFFPATITKVSDNGLYDVTFFDGDKEVGLNEAQIRVLSNPLPTVDTSKMTAKQLKRWKKEQEQNLK